MKKVKPGVTSVRNAVRDFELIHDYQSVQDDGWEFTVTKLVGKYQVSSSRIFEILEKNHIPKRGVKPIIDSK